MAGQRFGMFAVVNAECLIYCLSQRGLLSLGSVRSAVRLSLTALACELEKGWNILVAQDAVDACQNQHQASSAQIQLFLGLFHRGISTLTRNYNSDLSVRQGLFLLGEPRQIQTLALPSAAEQPAIVPHTFCTDPRTPGEVFCSIFPHHWSLQWHFSSPQSHPSMQPWLEKAGWCFTTREHHTWVEGCFSLSTGTQVWGGCL